MARVSQPATAIPEESRSFQNGVGALEFCVLPPQPANLGGLLAGGARPGPGIDLGLPDPLTDRLRRPDPSNSATRPIVDHSESCSPGDLRDHPHRPLLQLRQVPLRRISWHDSNLPKLWSLRTCRGDSVGGPDVDMGIDLRRLVFKNYLNWSLAVKHLRPD